LAILDYLGVDKAVVCGVSFGAAVAVAFALRHLERVTGLILVASAFGASRDQMGEGNLAAYGDLGERIAAEGLDVVIDREVDRTGSNRPRERWAQHDEASLVAFLRAVPLYRPFDVMPDLAGLAVPALVVAGEDAIHTPELSAAYAKALPDATEASAGRRDEALRSFLGAIG
jgi:3-oxoadipate enol-lactonase